MLIEGLQFFFTAFFDLDTERSHANGLTRIPWSKIKGYAEHYALSDEQTDDLLHFILRMDDAHLARLWEKQPKNGNAT